ncbi:hypothetical protein OROGR_022251 [Orobanche gracilis]
MAMARFFTISRRLLFTSSITHPPLLYRPSLARSLQSKRSTFTDSAASKDPIKSPLGYVDLYGNWALSEIAAMFPGTDYEHWVVDMHDTGGKEATKEQMVDSCIETLAQVVCSEEEAKRSIYKVICDPGFGLRFGCQLDWETAYKLVELPQVDLITPDFYDDPETKYYGGVSWSSMVRLLRGLLMNDKARHVYARDANRHLDYL